MLLDQFGIPEELFTFGMSVQSGCAKFIFSFLSKLKTLFRQSAQAEAMALIGRPLSGRPESDLVQAPVDGSIAEPVTNEAESDGKDLDGMVTRSRSKSQASPPKSQIAVAKCKVADSKTRELTEDAKD